MAQDLSKIKTRINSVSGALKVTKAMKLVSSIKVQKWKKVMLLNRDYVKCLEDISNIVFTHAKKIDSILLHENEKAEKNLWIVITSSLGLCGSYNQNIFKFTSELINSSDDLIVIGEKGRTYYAKNGFHVLEEYGKNASFNDEELIKDLSQFVLQEFNRGTYRSVHLIYTVFKNSLTFIPTDYRLLPFGNDISNHSSYAFGPIMEPSSVKIVDKLFPLYFKSTLYSKMLEAEVSEHASRSNAMDSATNNAEELLETLQLDFNKARQASITEEIIEIVGASRGK